MNTLRFGWLLSTTEAFKDHVMTIPLSRPLLGEEEVEAAARVLRSGWVMQGPEVLAFERELAEWVGAPHACALSSGTAALQLMLLGCGLSTGDEVITVSHSFVATANAIRLCGASPRFVDIEADTLNVDVRRVEAAIGPRTRAILCVHQLGMPCDLAALAEIAARRGLILLEDAACALGSELDGVKIGRPHSRAACFSFHPRKLITTGEGGMVTSGDAELDARIRRLRQHGDGVEVGFNYRMTDVQAAIGRVQLRRLPSLLEERRAQVARYRARLPWPMQKEPERARSNWQSLYVRVPDPKAISARLERQGIATRPGIANIHEMPHYATGESLPASEAATRQGLLLPLYPGLEVERVCDAANES
jgi:dTDP-4-amino-4,6-dideoxygalactose transaminase